VTLSFPRLLTVARREYLTTIRRKAFVVTVFGMPALWTVLFTMMIKLEAGESARALRNFHTLGVVDSAGVLAQAPPEIATPIDPGPGPGQNAAAGPQSLLAEVRFFPDAPGGDRALRAGQVDQLLIVPPDFMATGRLRQYALKSNLFSSSHDSPVTPWLVRGLLAGRVDSEHIERAARPARGLSLYTLNRQGEFELQDKARELMDLFLPLALGMLLSVAIVVGGQYLLQGIAEEKESRILESMLCTVSPEELLVGLGGSGLTMVGAWVVMGSFVAAPVAMMARIHVAPLMIATGVAYFLLGYLFYGSLMTGIGAVSNNTREAQQLAFVFTFMNFVPIYMISAIIGHPDGALAVGVSMFPPTAPISMLLRLAAPSSAVPWWQIALSMTLLAGAGVLAIMGAARLFRIGLLMYGKTPTLPEIVRWVREA
jgi:ABC-2 type transport system permease protein